MRQPLDGIRVADFSHVMAGPYASHILRLMGAEVIKIERKGGDPFRYYGSGDFGGMAPAFIAANAGKKSIALDLKDPGDADLAKRIVARCDVLIENFRPGAIGRLGFGYEEVCNLRPDIVYCSISGYGQAGPQRDWPAIDNIVQATSGMMMLSGGEGEPPVKVGFPVVDTLTGQTAASAILGALLQRERHGAGAKIEVSMFDASLAFMTSALTPFLVTGERMKRTGNTGYSGLPTASIYPTRDGRQVSLGVVQPNQFAALAAYLGCLDWLSDPRFATPQAQRKHFKELTEQLAHALGERDAEELERELSAVGVPCGMIRSVDEAVALGSKGAVLEIDIPSIPQLGAVSIPNAGFAMEPGTPGTNVPPPQLDEHRIEILAWLEAEPT